MLTHHNHPKSIVTLGFALGVVHSTVLFVGLKKEYKR